MSGAFSGAHILWHFTPDMLTQSRYHIIYEASKQVNVDKLI